MEVNVIYKCTHGEPKPNVRHKRKYAKTVGRPVGNSGSSGDSKSCQGWYTFGELEGDYSKF